MKKITIFSIIISILISIFVFSCAMSQQSPGGSLSVQMPSYISTGSRNLNNASSSVLKDLIYDSTTGKFKSGVRFEVGIELFGRRIVSIQLKPGDVRSLTVPAGVPLTIGVGMYLVNGSGEEINSYLYTDKKSKIVLMANEKRKLGLTLDMNKPTIVRTFFSKSDLPDSQITSTDNPGDSAIMTGFFDKTNNVPVFTSYKWGANSSEIIKYEGTSFTTIPKSSFGLSSLPAGDKGRFFRVFSPSNGVKTIWYVTKTGADSSGDAIYQYNGSTFQKISYTSDEPNGNNGVFINDNAINRIKSGIKRVISLQITGNSYPFESSNSTRTYYFLDYSSGFLAVNYGLASNSNKWSTAGDNRGSDFMQNYPHEHFLLDIEQDNDYRVTSSPPYIQVSPKDGTFFATQLGCYYLPEIAMAGFASGKGVNQGLENSKKMIYIASPNDPNKAILITKVKSFGPLLFLGTRFGIYVVNKTSAEWHKFADDIGTSNSPAILPQSAIKKIASIPGEPIVQFGEANIINTSNPLDPIIYKVLIAATPRRVFFIKIDASKLSSASSLNISDIVSAIKENSGVVDVWDGLPFTPKKYVPENSIDFLTHDTAKINFVMHDETTDGGVFWIGTNHGIGMIKDSEAMGL